MKKLKLLVVVLYLFTININAQNSEKKEQLKALKVAFITNELSLTADEASKFWPVFNAFEAKQQEIRGGKTKSYLKKMNNDDFDNLSDKDANNLLTQLEVTEDELFQNRKKLILNLKNILSPIKILKLKRAEENFSRRLLQQYKNKD
jgi:Spy/CpxP family protein refolding chaperone